MGFVRLEARAGIEPAHRAFAELGLTTWLPRHEYEEADVAGKKSAPQELKSNLQPKLARKLNSPR